MVCDGIKAVSGGRTRGSEPRPLVGAVISVPQCPAPTPSNPIHLLYQQGMHFPTAHGWGCARPARGTEGSGVKVFNQHI